MELVTGGLVLLALSIAFGELRSFDVSAISLASSAAWLYLVIAGTVLGFAAYIWLLKHMSPTFVSTYTFVNPVVALLLGWLVLGEHPTVRMLAGAALVVTSVAGLLLVGSPSNKQHHRMHANSALFRRPGNRADRSTRNRYDNVELSLRVQDLPSERAKFPGRRLVAPLAWWKKVGMRASIAPRLAIHPSRREVRSEGKGP
jgi:uncharacterized membrane protein